MFAFLSLEKIDLDLQLARQLSRRLAYYYLALPIAQDADGITLAMAHPENHQVVEVLETALNASVIPVQSYPEMIRQRLDEVWQCPQRGGVLEICCWGRSVEALDAASVYVEAMVTACGRMATVERQVAPDGSFAPGMADLVVIADEPLPADLFHTSASLLILRQPMRDPSLPHSMLHVLRGHVPDHRVLDWLIPLAERECECAEVTLLMGLDDAGKRPLVSDLALVLSAQDERHQHVSECRERLNAAGIGGRLKLRQGAALDGIADELCEHHYDLVAIAAEAYGNFVNRVWEEVQGRTSAFLVIQA